MKKLLLSMITTAVLVGCSSSTQNKEAQLEEAIEIAQTSPVIEKKLFLGFQFDMSEQDVRNHLDSLAANGKVYTDEIGRYTYNFDADVTLQLTFEPQFIEGKLYRMDYRFDGGPSDNRGLRVLQAATTFMKTDREGFKSFMFDNALGDTQLYFVKNNLIIQFDASPLGIMSYTNAPAYLRLKELKDEKVSRTISDF